MSSKSATDRSVSAEAAAWIAQLQRPDRDADLEKAFRKWLRSHPAHALAFEQATTVWHQLPGVGALYRERTRRRARWRQLSAAAAVVMVAGLLLLWRALSGDVYATAVGEQRLVKLEDGSWITLNTNTSIKVRYGWNRRYLALERGEAIFDVTKDARRPFIVATDREQVRAVGTSFAVRRDEGAVSVALLEGKVIVEPSRWQLSANEIERAEMAAGQTWHSRDGAVNTPPPAQFERLTAWRHGQLVFSDTTLREAVAEMNRYSSTSLIIETPGAGSLPITGVFKIRDSSQFAQTVASLYDLTVVAQEERIVLSGSGGSTRQ